MQFVKRLLPILLVVALILPGVTPAYANTIYVVQTGDTLYTISLKFNVTMTAIMEANGMTNPNLVYVGQQLIIPTTTTSTTTSVATSGTVYVVQSGDTLNKISLKFNVSQAKIMGANGMTNPNIVYVGQRLMIPGSDWVPTTTTTTPSNATGTNYVVQSGDTLSRIAQKYSVTIATLMSVNGITNANLIFVGQRLVISGSTSVPATPAPTASAPQAATPTPVVTTPPVVTGGTTHVVVRGDTLWGISMKYGVSVASIKTANGLTTDFIYVGQRLTIPAAGSTPTTPVATPTPAPGATPTPIVVAPPVSSGSFELGGQANDITGSTAKMKYAGMAWVKVQDRWSPGATAGGGKIQEAHNQGFKILLSVLGNPGDISGGANFDSYAAYVGQLAALGADGIEVWNEMNIDREWPAGQINPSTYTDLLRRSYNQIKARNASTLVISGALAPTGAEGAFGADHVWNDNRYIAGMASAGAANYLDCIGIHYNEGILSPTRNSGDPRQDYYTRYYSGMVSTYYNAFGGARKLCFTELGYLTPEGYGALPGTFAWAAGTTLAQQAQWLGEAASLSKSGGVVRLMVVFNVDFKVYGDDPQAGYAIIRPNGGCPACENLRAVTGGR
jgi:LysM repeat protein